MRIEEKIISNLIFNENYIRKVSPHLDIEYFTERSEKIITDEILTFFRKYNKVPTKDILTIELSNRTDISDKDLSEYNDYLNKLDIDDSNYDWLLDNTEKYCRDKAVYNAILKSIGIMNGSDPIYTKDSIPKILQDALGVSFDQSVGHNYLEDGDKRYEFYHAKEDKIPFDLEKMNDITNGGLSLKSLSIVLAGSGRGKSAFLCHVAASTLLQSKNVLYITLEMAEERIAERIDANLMNITMDELKTIEKPKFDNKLARINKKTRGNLVIKEYPTTSAHTGHFRALLEELKIKKEFVPHLLIVDYLNICASSRIKNNNAGNSFTLYKSIAEELRGLGMEYNVPVLSASQLTRGSQTSSDVELTDIAESIGVIYVADLVFALMGSEELDRLHQIAVKQLKNRYSPISKNTRFVIGIDMDKMKFYDVESSAQRNLTIETYDEYITPETDISTVINTQITHNKFNEFLF